MPQKITSKVDFDTYAACRETVDKSLPPAHVAPGGKPNTNTLRVTPLNYVYMDCGRWGGTKNYPVQRNFGVVWERWAVLCEYQASGSAPPPLEAQPTPIDAVLKAVCGGGAGVRIVDKAYSTSPIEPETDTVYVFVPDLHLPITHKTPHFMPTLPGPGFYQYPEYPQNPSPAMGRDSWALLGAGGYLDEGTDIGGTKLTPYGDRALCYHAVEWYENYEKNDIFERAGDDLVPFLKRLNQYVGKADLHLVQLGDMYELWNGLGRCFESTDRHETHLPLQTKPDLRDWRPGGASGETEAVTPEAFVAFWVEAVGREFPELMQAFKNVKGDKTFLHGNHDNYLSVVTVPGHDATVPELRTKGLYVEHGHRSDSVNRDGATTGYQLAIRNFVSGGKLRPWERTWDKLDKWGNEHLPAWRDQRQKHIDAASLSFAEAISGKSSSSESPPPGKPFCVYVMGHTHAPMVAQVTLKPGAFPVPPPPPGMGMMGI